MLNLANHTQLIIPVKEIKPGQDWRSLFDQIELPDSVLTSKPPSASTTPLPQMRTLPASIPYSRELAGDWNQRYYILI